MSLSALVAFAQQNFGRLSEHTRDGEPGIETPGGMEKLVPPNVSPRPGLPAWVRQRTVERELPQGPEYPWRIEGAIDRQQPPPDVATLGADALAFYAPFHFYRKGWGIFIRMSGVMYLAEVLKGDRLDSGDEKYLDLAEFILREHEWHHAATEIACTRADLTSRSSFYQPYFASADASHLEEALANAQAISWVFQDGDPLGAKPRAESWMSQQGQGYRDYGSWLSSRAFSQGRNHAARLMACPLPDPSPRADSSLHTFLFRGARHYRSMPYVRVNDLGSIGVTVLRPFPKAHGVQVFVHSNDHPPPHIHVQVLSGGEETRYSWPGLVPLENDKPLSGAAQKGLSRYVDLHGSKIDARVQAVYGKDSD